MRKITDYERLTIGPESLSVGELNQVVRDLREMLHQKQLKIQEFAPVTAWSAFYAELADRLGVDLEDCDGDHGEWLLGEVERLKQTQENITKIRSMELKNGELDIDLDVPKNLAGIIASSFIDLLNKEQAPNYCEMEFSKGTKRVLVTIHRPHGKRPAQLQKEAEKELAQAREQITQLQARIADMQAVDEDNGVLREANAKLRLEKLALTDALVYAKTKRDGQFDFDEWNRLVEHALAGKAAPSALENEIAAHAATQEALKALRAKVTDLETQLKQDHWQNSCF